MKIFLVIMILTCIFTKITVLPDDQNPIQILNPYKDHRFIFKFKFSIEEEINFLFKNQFIGVILPSILTTDDLGYDVGGKFDCFLEDEEASHQVKSFYGVNSPFDSTSIAETNYLYCQYLGDVPLVGGVNKKYTYTIQMKDSFKSLFIQSVDLFFSSSNNPDKIIYGASISLGYLAQYNNYRTNTNKPLKINSASLIPVSGFCSESINQCSNVYPNTYFDISMVLTADQFIFSKKYVDIIIELDHEICGFDEGKIPTITASIENALDPSLLDPWSGIEVEYLNYGIFRISNFKYDIKSGTTHNLKISGNMYALDNKIETIRKIKVYVYWKNSYSILSYDDKEFFFIKATDIYFTPRNGFTGISHPELWDLYENSAWPVKFTMSFNNDIPSGGYLLIKHANLTKSSIIQFISSTCDFSQQFDSNNYKYGLGESLICHPLNNDGEFDLTSSATSGKGSGIFIKLGNIKAFTPFTVTVWVNVFSCSSKTIDQPHNISINDPDEVVPEFSYTLYKNIYHQFRGNSRFNHTDSLSHVIIAKSSSNIKLTGKCKSNLTNKNSTTYDFTSVYNNFVVYSVSTTKVERDYLLFKETSMWGFIPNSPSLANTDSYNTLTEETSSLQSYLLKSNNAIGQFNIIHINIEQELKSNESLIDKFPFPYFQNDNNDNLGIYLKPGAIEIKISRGLFTSKLAKLESKSYQDFTGTVPTEEDKDCRITWGGIFPNEDIDTNSDSKQRNLKIDSQQKNVITLKTQNISSEDSNLFETVDTEMKDFANFHLQKQIKLQSTNTLNKLSLDLNRNDSTSTRFLPNSHLKNLSSDNFMSNISIVTDCYEFDEVKKNYSSIYFYSDILVSNLTSSIDRTSSYPHRTIRFISFLNGLYGAFSGTDKFMNLQTQYVVNHFSFTKADNEVICILEITSELFSMVKQQDYTTPFNTILIFLYNVNLMSLDPSSYLNEYPALPITKSTIKSYGFNSSIYTKKRYGKLNEIIDGKETLLKRELDNIYTKNNQSNSKSYFNYMFQLGSLIIINGIESDKKINDFTTTNGTRTNSMVIPYICPINKSTDNAEFEKYYTMPVISLNLTKIDEKKLNKVEQPSRLATVSQVKYQNIFFNSYLENNQIDFTTNGPTPATIVQNYYLDKPTAENSKFSVYNGNLTQVGTDRDCSSFILLLDEHLTTAEPVLTFYDVNEDPVGEYPLQTSLFTFPSDYYYIGKKFNKIVISLAPTSIPVYNTIDDSGETNLYFNYADYEYTNIKAPEFQNYEWNVTDYETFPGHITLDGIYNTSSFTCVSQTDHSNYITNFVNYTNSFYSIDAYLFNNDFKGNYFNDDVDYYLPLTVNFIDEFWYQENSYSSLEAEFSLPYYIPKNSPIFIVYNRDLYVNLFGTTQYIINGLSKCGLMMIESGSNTETSDYLEDSLVFSDCTNKDRYGESGIDCILNKHYIPTSRLKLCCYNVLQIYIPPTSETNNGTRDNYNGVNDKIFSSIVIYNPLNYLEWGFDTGNSEVLYSENNIFQNLDTQGNYSSPFDKAIDSEISNPAVITDIIYSQINQPDGYGRAYFKVQLPREPFLNMDFNIDGDLSGLLIKDSIIPRCVYTFNSEISPGVDTPIFNDFLKGDYLQDSCRFYQKPGTPEYTLQFSTKNFIYKCGMKRLSRKIIIMLWPIQTLDFILYKNNQYSISFKQKDDAGFVNKITTTTYPKSNFDSRTKINPIINDFNMLCPITKVIPRTVGDKGDYFFTFNLQNLVQSQEPIIIEELIRITANREINEITVFFPHYYFSNSYKVSCIDETKLELLVCGFSDENILNIRLNSPIILKTNSEEMVNRTIRVSEITNPLIENSFDFACTLNNYDKESLVRQNIITGTGNSSDVTPFCHSIALNNLQGNIRVYSLNKSEFMGSLNYPQDIIQKLTIKFSIDTTQNLVTLPISFSQTPMFIVTFPEQFNIENSFSFRSDEKKLSLETLLEFEFTDEQLIVEKNNPPSISKIYIYGNKIVIYLQDNSRVLFDKYAYWILSFKNFPNPWKEETSTSRIQITLTNETCTFLFKTYVNLSSEFGEQKKLPIKEKVSTKEYIEDNIAYKDNVNYTPTTGNNNYDKEILMHRNVGLIHFYRGYEYDYYFDGIKPYKYSLLINYGEPIFGLRGRYNVITFTVNLKETLLPDITKDEVDLNNIDKIINVITNISIRFDATKFRLSNISLSTNANQRFIGFFGVDCHVFPGNHLVYLKASNEDNFLNISPVTATVKSENGNIFFVPYSTDLGLIKSKISGLSSIGFSNINFYVGDKTLFYAFASEPPFNDLEIEFEKASTENSVYIDKGLIKDGKIYKVFEAKNDNLNTIPSNVIFKPFLPNNKCYQIIDLAGEILTFDVITKDINLDRIDNMNLGSDNFVFKDSSFTVGSKKNSIFSSMTFDKNDFPLYVFCSVYCPEDYRYSEPSDEEILDFSFNSLLNDFGIREIHDRSSVSFSTKFYGLLFEEQNPNNKGFVEENILGVDNDSSNQVIEIENLIRGLNYNAKCIVTDKSYTVPKYKIYRSEKSPSLIPTAPEEEACFQLYFNQELNEETLGEDILGACQTDILYLDSPDKTLADILTIQYSQSYYEEGCYTCLGKDDRVVKGFFYGSTFCMNSLKLIREYTISTFNTTDQNLFYKDFFDKNEEIQTNTNRNNVRRRILNLNKNLRFLNETENENGTMGDNNPNLSNDTNNSNGNNTVNSNSTNNSTDIDQIEEEIKYVYTVCISQMTTCRTNGNLGIFNLKNLIYDSLFNNKTYINNISQRSLLESDSISNRSGSLRNIQEKNQNPFIKSVKVDINEKITKDMIEIVEVEYMQTNITNNNNIFDKFTIKLDFVSELKAKCYWIIHPVKSNSTFNQYSAYNNKTIGNENSANNTTNDIDLLNNNTTNSTSNNTTNLQEEIKYKSIQEQLEDVFKCLEDTNFVFNYMKTRKEEFMNYEIYIDYLEYVFNGVEIENSISRNYNYTTEELEFVKKLFINNQCGWLDLSNSQKEYTIYFLDALFSNGNFVLDFYCHYEVPSTKVQISDAINIKTFNYQGVIYNGKINENNNGNGNGNNNGNDNGIDIINGNDENSIKFIYLSTIIILLYFAILF